MPFPSFSNGCRSAGSCIIQPEALTAKPGR
jgi:hypothetical protein